MANFKSILITGGSSGIGRALAIEYSQKNINLFLCARNLEELKETKKLCENSQKFSKEKAGQKKDLMENLDGNLRANIYLKILDVKDEIACQKLIEEIEQTHPLDLVIANAGVSAGTAGGIENFEQIKEIFNTNLCGVLNIIQPAIRFMKNRHCGQIVIISSLAGFRGLPSSPAYSASKAAVRVYGEALRGNLAEFGIAVNVVCPGYIKTKMTAVNNFYMPFLMESDKAAKIIIAGIKKNLPRITFPIIFYLVICLAMALPMRLSDKIFRLLPKKSAIKN